MEIKLNILKIIKQFFTAGNYRQLPATNSKKSNIGIQTFFFILMSILMIWIIYFGISKMFLVNDTINENERIQYKNQLESAFKYCEDPLNSGSSKTIIINSNVFNGVCILGSDTQEQTYKYKNIPEFKTIYDSKINIALIKFDFLQLIQATGKYTPKNIQIIDSFKIPFEQTNTQCYFKENEKKKLEVKIPCSKI